ncbi:hypothetical protein [Polluticaenibacter yanchengensis]|uniref:Stabilization protein n=1 Tax=Polluticaenibacter yanchengensis TaxID=3014562 RepID=A0ABT4UKH1_9BACT|nr:hypothetical protein [Chitinophagaceae bacterium LY-5]
MRISIGEDGKAGYLKIVEGQTPLPFVPISALSPITIGSYNQVEKNRVYYFVAISDNEVNIYCYDGNDNKAYTVLLNSQVSGGLRLRSTDVLSEIKMNKDILYWTNGRTNTNRINVESALKGNDILYPTPSVGYQFPMDITSLTLIKRPFNIPLRPVTFSDTTGFDNVSNHAFYFATRLRFWDGEESVLSPFSTLVNYQYDGYFPQNAILVFLPYENIIQQDVRKIEFIAINAETNLGEVVYVLDKENIEDLNQITRHNSGTEQISFRFKNAKSLETVDSPTIIKQFDSVPLSSQTLEIFRNRVFLGNNDTGYNPPLESHLRLNLITATTGAGLEGYYVKFDVAGFYISLSHRISAIFAYLPLDFSTTKPYGYYVLTANNWATPQVSIININDYTFIGNSPESVVDWMIQNRFSSPTPPSPVYTLWQAIIKDEKTNVVFETSNHIEGYDLRTPTFKSQSSYAASIVFYDQYMRKCGVHHQVQEITTSDRGYGIAVALNSKIEWEITNAGDPNTIPEWAYYYSVVLTKNLRTSFFVQFLATEIKYANRDNDGNYTYSYAPYSDNFVGVAVNLNSLVSQGKGYTMSDGDMVKIYPDDGGDLVVVPVTEQIGSYIIVPLTSIGETSASRRYIVEIYTPTQPISASNFYEVGEINIVQDPETVDRRFTKTKGVFEGDIYIKEVGSGAGMVYAEEMSPRNNKWKFWNTSHSRINIYDPIGNQKKINDVRFSNAYLDGAARSGLSSFDALDVETLPVELNGLMKLQGTTKAASEGNVILAIGRQQTCVLYVGESAIQTASGGQLVVKSDGVISQVNPLKGNFGTLHRESVQELDGHVFWLDVNNRAIVRYDINGLDDLPLIFNSKTYLRKICENYLNPIATDIGELGIIPTAKSGIDRDNLEYLIQFSQFYKTSQEKNPYDPYTGLNQVFVWSVKDRTFVGHRSFKADNMSMIFGKLISFIKGLPYIHNNKSLIFNGTSQNAIAGVINSDNGNFIKVYKALAVEGDKPDSIEVYTFAPNRQRTEMDADEIKTHEGVHYVNVMRDMNSPNTKGGIWEKRAFGDPMRGENAFIKVIYTGENIEKYLKILNINPELSLGSI